MAFRTLALIVFLATVAAAIVIQAPEEDIEERFVEEKALQDSLDEGLDLDVVRGSKNGRDHKSKRKGHGLWMGKRFESAPTKKVLMNDGTAYHELSLSLRPDHCREKITGYKVKGYTNRVLGKRDVSVFWDRIDQETYNFAGRCAVHTYNVTAEVRFNKFPGSSRLKLVVYTRVGAKKKAYSFAASYLAVGVVVFEKKPKWRNIRSGDRGKPKKLGTFKRIEKRGLYRLKVAVQGPQWNTVPNPRNIDLRMYDPDCDNWANYVSWDASCPAAYVTKQGMWKKKSKVDNFNAENGQCNASFTKDMKNFYIRVNPSRVGCGKFCIEMTWRSLKIGDAPFTTHFCFKIDQAPVRQVVTNCMDVKPDYYGGDQFSLDVYNLHQVQHGELADAVPTSFKFGGAAWDITDVQMASAHQRVTVKASSFEETEARDLNIAASSGVFVFKRPDGTEYEVKSKVECGAGATRGKIRASYQSPEVVELQPTERSSEDTEIVEVQIFTPSVEKMSASRMDKYLSALPVFDGKVADIKSRDTSKPACSWGVCAMFDTVSSLIFGSRAAAGVAGTEVKIHFEVDSLDMDETVDRIMAAADDFNKVIDSVDVQISYVGVATDKFVTVG